MLHSRPRTGRTHQIRVHLQHVGHPIANDTQYGGMYPGPCQPRAFQTGAPGKVDSCMAKRHKCVDSVLQGLPNEKQLIQISDPANSEVLPTVECAEEVGNNSPAATDSPRVEVGVADAAWQGAWAPKSGNRPAPSTDGQANTGFPAADGLMKAAPGQDFPCPSGDPPKADSEAVLRALVPEGLQDSFCLHCPHMCPEGSNVQLSPLWLHAQDYSCTAWNFHCPPPRWACHSWIP